VQSAGLRELRRQPEYMRAAEYADELRQLRRALQCSSQWHRELHLRHLRPELHAAQLQGLRWQSRHLRAAGDEPALLRLQPGLHGREDLPGRCVQVPWCTSRLRWRLHHDSRQRRQQLRWLRRQLHRGCDLHERLVWLRHRNVLRWSWLLHGRQDLPGRHVRVSRWQGRLRWYVLHGHLLHELAVPREVLLGRHPGPPVSLLGLQLLKSVFDEIETILAEEQLVAHEAGRCSEHAPRLGGFGRGLERVLGLRVIGQGEDFFPVLAEP
jgi:hypothetical protein